MATAHAHQRKRKHIESKKIRTNKHSIRRSIFGERDKTKEYIIYWLFDDVSLQDDYLEMSKIKLRGIIDYLRKISDVNELEKTNDQNIFLVINFTTLDQHFTQLVTIKQIRLIYVYDHSQHTESPKSKDESFVGHSKIRGPFHSLDELFNTLSKNLRTMTVQPDIANELPPLTSASKTIERSTSAAYSYVTDWYIHLIRALQEIPPARSCKEKFVEECSILYKDNPSILQAIQEFNNTYVPEDAIRWYTRDGFLYKVLNRILREKNQQAMQLIHFLIYDLHRQLKKELRNTEQDWIRADTVRLYRGQLMSMEELEQLKKNRGEVIFVNSFLSMTTDLAVANMFSGAGAFGPNDPIQSIIFHVEWADSCPKQGIADIHRLSFNGDEGEVLVSPTYTINLLDCVYDEKERVWNVKFSRIMQTDDPLIRITDDECLMRLELLLRYLIEEKDSSHDDIEEMEDEFSDSDDSQLEFTRKFCSIFVEDVLTLKRELELPELCSVTLNNDKSGRFELTTFQSFTSESFDHEPKIHDEMFVTLYDALGSVFKTKGKLMQAYYYFQKSSTYDKSQSQTSYTRQAHLAQIHKSSGDHELAWNIFNELMDRTDDTDNFLYEDIAFARSKNMSDEMFFQNTYAFLEYCSTYDNNDNDNDNDNDDDDDDDDDDETDLFMNERVSYIIDAWAELGYKYFYQIHDAKQALNCYEREKELSLATSKVSSAYFNPLIGSCAERMADVHASQNEIEKALTLYEEALNLSKKETFITNVMAAARCACKIGRYSSNHKPDIFYHSFQNLIQGYGKPYTRDTIGKCYVYLSQSLQRCERYHEALKYAKQALSIFLTDPLLLERLIDNCCQLVLELYQTINKNDEKAPTKEEILNDRISLNDEQIKEMLQTTLDELKNELDNTNEKSS